MDLTKLVKQNSGQAFILVVIAAAVGSVVLFGIFLLSNATLITIAKISESTLVHGYAESGIEEGILRLLRDPAFTSTSFSLSGSSVSINVSGSNPYTITSTATLNNIRKRAQANVGVGDSVVINSWKEIE